MSHFGRIHDATPIAVWDGLRARTVTGQRLTLAVVDIDPGASLPQHHHENEQLGLMLRGTLQFTVGGETRELVPGETWNIPPNVPHSATAGPDGCTVVDVFAPVRADWEDLDRLDVSLPHWP